MAFKIADGYVEVHARVDKSKTRQAAQRAGQDAGGRFSDNFTRAGSRRLASNVGAWREAFKKAIPANILTFAPIIASIGTAAAGATTALIGLVSSLGQGLGSAAAMATALAGVAGVGFVIYKGWQEINRGPFKEAKRNMSQLGDRAVKAAKPAFDELFGAVNEHFHVFNMWVRRSGDALRGFSSVIAGAFADRGLADKLGQMFEFGARGAERLMAALGHVVESLVTLGAAAGPLFVRFAGWLDRVTIGWRRWLDEAHKTGELTRILNIAGDQLATWGGIVGNLMSGLVGIFAGAAVQGRALADALLRISERFKEWAWSDETHGKIQRLLQFFMELDYGRIFQIAAAITAMGLAFKTMVGVGSIIQGLLQLVALGPVGLAVTAVAIGVGLLAAAFVRAYTSSETFRTMVNDLWTDIVNKLQPVLDTLREVIDTHLGPAWQRLVDAVAANRAELATFAAVVGGSLIVILGGLVIALSKVVNWFAGMIESIGQAVRAWQAFESAFAAGVIILINLAQRLLNAVTIVVEGMLRSFANFVGTFSPSMASAMNTAADNVRNFRVRANRNLNAVKSKIHTEHIMHIDNAIARINRVKAALAHIPRHIRTVHAVSLVRQEAAQANRRSRTGGVAGLRTGGFASPRERARGGPGGGWTWVGEDGPELAKLPTGTQVRNHNDSKRQAAAAASSSGGGTVVLQFAGRPGSLDEALFEWLREGIRVRGGDPVEVLGST